MSSFSRRTAALSSRGMTLIEVLVASLVVVLLGAGVWTLMRSSFDSQYELMGMNSANLNARQAVDMLSDGWGDSSSGTAVAYEGLRGANAITNAAASDITYTYLDKSGTTQTVRFWLDNTNNLRRTVNAAPTGGTVVVSGVTALTFTYYSWNGTSLAAGTVTSVANVGAVDFAVTAASNGATRQVSGSVRLRQKRFP